MDQLHGWVDAGRTETPRTTRDQSTARESALFVLPVRGSSGRSRAGIGTPLRQTPISDERYRSCCFCRSFACRPIRWRTSPGSISSPRSPHTPQESPAPQELCDLLTVDSVPDEDALHCDGEIFAERFNDPGKPNGVGIQVLVHQDRPGFVGDADVHHACVKIDSAVVFVTMRGEAYSLSPPRNGWFMRYSELSHCTSLHGGGGVNKYQAHGAVGARLLVRGER